MKDENDVLVWIDLEMDGLDLTKNFILEIACILTNFDLTKIREGPDLVIHHRKGLLDAMGPWCMEHHTKSGLVRQVLDSKLSMADAQAQIIDFIRGVTGSSARLILAGNSVYIDRYFLEKDMPKLSTMLDRSILDCSTLKELIRRFNPLIYQRAPVKSGNLHRALDDIRNSIEEFRYYKDHAFEEKKSVPLEEFLREKDLSQYLVWIEIHSMKIHCILTDGNLNIVDEIVDGKNDENLLGFFRRNGIHRSRTVVVAGTFLGSIRAQLNELASRFNEFCHYRSIDVDVVSIVCEKFFPSIYQQRPISEEVNDVKHSIELLRFYRSTIFK